MWCGDTDSMLGCEMDGGPCVVICWIYVFVWRNASPVCRDVGLVVAMTLLAVEFDGWQWQGDLLCLTLVRCLNF